MESELVLGIPVMLALIAVFLICYLYLYQEIGLPPGPRKLPFVGDMLFLRRIRKGKKPSHQVLHEEAKKSGDIVYLRIGNQRVVIFHGYDMIHEVFVNNAGVASHRPSWMPSIRERTKEGRGLVWQDGPEWKAMRKFVLQALRDFGVGKTSLEERIAIETDTLVAQLNKIDGEPVEIKHLLSHKATNIIHGIIFGKRLEDTDGTLGTIVEVIGNGFMVTRPIFGDNAPDWLFKLLSPDLYKKAQTKKRSLQWIKDYVHHQIERHEHTYDANNIRDFIDVYIQARSQEDDKKKVQNGAGNLFRLIMDLFIAGTETSFNTLNWCVLFMQEYPDIQNKCKDQIQDVCGTRRVVWSDRHSLIYIQAVLLEIQRLGAVAAFSVYHTNEVDFTVNGYRIPRRTLMLANIYSSLMDPKYWHDPHVFNPDRFIADGMIKKPPAFIPFSLGPRVCPGDSLAKIEMFLIFTNILQKFTFKKEDPDFRHSFDIEPGHTTSSPLTFKTRAIPC